VAAHAASAPRSGTVDLLSFAAPLWLSGLLLLPVIRWLHRGGAHRRAVAVSRLDLWPRSAASRPAAGERRPPDPAWRRRALFAALLFVALSEPQITEQRTRVTLWVDDSLSMRTREANGTRLGEALAQARSLLAGQPGADVELRTLGDPWRNLGALTEASIATIAAGAGAKKPAPPPAALLRGDRQHWLITDGAHPTLLDWPGGGQPDRVIQVAAVTRNVGLERLSARRSSSDPGRYDLLLKATNGGTDVETREIAFDTDAGEVDRSTLHIEPGASVFVNAVIPASASVRASLHPADALAEDDDIVLDLHPLRRRRVATDPNCPAALVAAVRAHPALTVADANDRDADAALVCGTPARRGAPTLLALANRLPERLDGPLQWSPAVPESRRLRLDAEQLRAAARLLAEPGDEVLLAAGDEPLIIRRSGPVRVLETSLDFASTRSARAETPLLVNLMFEQLLAGPLLDEVATVDRGAASAIVAPSRRAEAPAASSSPKQSRARRDLTRALLVGALLVLLWEAIALGFQWHRLRDFAGAPGS
jgi:hypothetical protein